MKLKYKILWVEDEKDWVESEIEFIENYLKKYGFVLEYENPEKYKKCDFSQFDIIIVDYNLSNEEKGQNVIEMIRKQELYTDILFYSIDGEDKLRGLVKDMDGIYCASKDSCRKKLEGLIKTTIRKTQELNNLRGLVMAETSESDEMIKEILKLLVEKDKVKEEKIVEIKQDIIKYYKTNLTGDYERKIKGIEQYKLPKDFSELLDSRHLTSYFSMKTLKSFSTCDKNLLIKKDISSYSEVQEERNNLAHNIEDSSTSTLMKIRKRNGTIIEYDEEKFIKIRKKIQKYKQIFQKIKDDLIN